MAVYEPIYDVIDPIGACDDEPSSVHCIDLLLDDDAMYEGVVPFVGGAGGPQYFMSTEELSSSSDEEHDSTIAPSVGSSELSEDVTLEDMLSRKRGPGFVGAYSPEERRDRIARFHEKRARRVWKKRVTYSTRKNIANKRMRVKGRFIKKSEVQRLQMKGGGDVPSSGSGGDATPAAEARAGRGAGPAPPPSTSNSEAEDGGSGVDDCELDEDFLLVSCS